MVDDRWPLAHPKPENLNIREFQGLIVQEGEPPRAVAQLPDSSSRSVGHHGRQGDGQGMIRVTIDSLRYT
ncbi:MAG: hypothetical protein ACK53L_36310, partial [Pirellulaceae bacterium]